MTTRLDKCLQNLLSLLLVRKIVVFKRSVATYIWSLFPFIEDACERGKCFSSREKSVLFSIEADLWYVRGPCFTLSLPPPLQPWPGPRKHILSYAFVFWIQPVATAIWDWSFGNELQCPEFSLGPTGHWLSIEWRRSDTQDWPWCRLNYAPKSLAFNFLVFSMVVVVLPWGVKRSRSCRCCHKDVGAAPVQAPK